jgi:DNA-binding XRE family transcriptional regulator
MDVVERERIRTDIQTQLTAGEISIGVGVRRLRKEVTGLEQARFARMCKISVRALRQLEHDEANPTLHTLNSIFRMFGMQVGLIPIRRE